MITRRPLLLSLSALLATPALARTADEIAYGADPAQKLDAYPAAAPGSPILVYVHGGSWRRGDKRRVNQLPEYARRHGLALVSVNYRMAPQVDAGGCAEDVAAAVACVRENAARIGGDPQRIYVAGHSAGAHLAALIAVDPRYLGAHGMQPEQLAGAVLLDGAGYDAVAQMRFLQGRLGLLPNAYESAFGDRAAELSPTLLAAPGRAYPPFLIFHVAERPDAQRQSQGLAEALRAAGGRAEVVPAPGETHMTINRDFGKPGDPEGERAAPFILTGAL